MKQEAKSLIWKIHLNLKFEVSYGVKFYTLKLNLSFEFKAGCRFQAGVEDDVLIVEGYRLKDKA